MPKEIIQISFEKIKEAKYNHRLHCNYYHSDSSGLQLFGRSN